MTAISVVIITFNESLNIERCIRSVLPIADEIVVVDSFSTDDTLSIAKTLGAKVFSHPFEGHIQQKNYAIGLASYKHILSLDADEWIEPQLVSEIALIKENFKADGYVFNRLNNYCGQWIKHGAWYPDKKLRLWNSEKGSWQGLNPHDEFKMDVNAVIEYCPLNILHQSYRSLDEHRKQSEYFSSLAANAYFVNNKKSNWLKIVLSPVIRFIRDYIIKLGFLDGRFGFIIAINTAKEVYKKYLKLKQLQDAQSL